MCTVCGCNEPGPNDHASATMHEHHHFGKGSAGVSVGGFSQDRLIEIEQNILSKNDEFAHSNRQWLKDRSILALNLLSSPGAGKTTLLVETLKKLKHAMPLCVIEGDQETENDAEQIRKTGVNAIQINTGKGCHLDAHMTGHALQDTNIQPGGVIFIENIGNLVCPAAFDLGEAHKVVILSVTEGEDKPIKYPDMFAAADLMILSKIDLLGHLEFDVNKVMEHAMCVNPGLKIINVSAKTGAGIDQWLDWIKSKQLAPVSSYSQNKTGEKSISHA